MLYLCFTLDFRSIMGVSRTNLGKITIDKKKTFVPFLNLFSIEKTISVSEKNMLKIR